MLFPFIVDEVDDMRHQLKHDKDGLLISSFCYPRLYSLEAALSAEKYDPVITWFRLSAGAHNMIEHLYAWKESAVFWQIWKAQMSQVGMDKKLTVDQIEQSSWRQSDYIWGAFCRGMVGVHS